MAFTPGLARADGGPASDVLSSQALFVPPDAGLSATQQAQLGALVAAARADGYDLRVAVIARSADLGSVTALWRQPANYARFLGQEIALVAHGPPAAGHPLPLMAVAAPKGGDGGWRVPRAG
jgi:hypothetical protein